MTMSTVPAREGRTDELTAGDRVVIVDAPSWVRRYFTGRSGRVLRVLPFPGGDVWVRFERPVIPWCDRMEPVEEFPFAPEQLAAA
ncbi:MAG: hypothetical protein Q8Q00_14105 [Dehalococcoidia bacterium]|nr:hypothetical protein [Dehalococcoidia bacterium]